MSIGRLITGSASAVLLLSLCLSLGASAQTAQTTQATQTTQSISHTSKISKSTHLTECVPGAPVYFEKTFSVPNKILIVNSKNGEPDFENMSESTAVRVGCGPVSVIDLSSAVGQSTQPLGLAWGFTLLVLSQLSYKKGRENAKGFVWAGIVIATAWVLPFILVPAAFICFVGFLWKLCTKKKVQNVSGIVLQSTDIREDSCVGNMPSNLEQESSTAEAVKPEQEAVKPYVELLERCFLSEGERNGSADCKDEAELCLLK